MTRSVSNYNRDLGVGTNNATGMTGHVGPNVANSNHINNGQNHSGGNPFTNSGQLNRSGLGNGPGGNLAGRNGNQRFPGEFNFSQHHQSQFVGHNLNAFSHHNLANHCNNIRRNFYGGGFYNNGWYGNYFSPWWPGIWYGGGLWGGLGYGGLCNFCGFNTLGYPYNYGTNVVYTDGQVLVNGDSVGTPAQYYQQAARIASKGVEEPIPQDEEWQALGLFALSKEKEKESTNMVQLAINRDGLIRGNYYNSVLNTTLPVTGSVDKKTQRAAWTVGDNKNTVYEAGVKNLTQEQTTCLVHYSDRRTEQLIMSRLKEPEKAP